MSHGCVVAACDVPAVAMSEAGDERERRARG